MRRLVIGIIAGAVLATATVAAASIPSADGTFYGCVRADGTLVVKDDRGTGDITCGAQATKIHWNQTDPQGPAGQQGPPGLSGVHVVTHDVPWTNTTTVFETVDCLSGEVALSAAGSAYQSNGAIIALGLNGYQAEALTDALGRPTGYRMSGEVATSDTTTFLRFQVTCATAT